MRLFSVEIVEDCKNTNDHLYEQLSTYTLYPMIFHYNLLIISSS